jgi:NAD(P)-dependent dehydrogenase (short-subunit alcohol dehydrogenase family)
MIDLKGKKIAVTGASSGIGREVAILVSKLGADLILTGRNQEALNETASQIATNCEVILCDLSVEEEIENFAKKIKSIDGLAHCAGIVQPFPIKFIKSKHIDTVLKINLYSGILLCSNLLRNKSFNNGSSLVFISSVSADHPYNGSALYSISKKGLEAFARSFSLEQSIQKMRANVVVPALVNTNIYEKTKAAYDEEFIKKIEAQYPLGIGEPIDVANMIAFLLSNNAQWITGTSIKMDGGLLLNNNT